MRSSAMLIPALIVALSLAVPAHAASKSQATEENLEASVIELGAEAKAQVLEALEALPYWIPLYPGAKANMTSAAQKTPDSVTVLVSFDTTETPDKITAFYAEQLARAKLGDVEKTAGAEVSNLYLESRDANETCDITITAGEGSQPGNVSINYYHSNTKQ